jgi:hypothetical protein
LGDDSARADDEMGLHEDDHRLGGLPCGDVA